MKGKFKVTVDLPKGVTQVEMGEYIKQSIRTMAGSLHPDDPMFDLDRDSVKVSVFRRMCWECGRRLYGNSCTKLMSEEDGHTRAFHKACAEKILKTDALNWEVA